MDLPYLTSAPWSWPLQWNRDVKQDGPTLPYICSLILTTSALSKMNLHHLLLDLDHFSEVRTLSKMDLPYICSGQGIQCHLREVSVRHERGCPVVRFQIEPCQCVENWLLVATLLSASRYWISCRAGWPCVKIDCVGWDIKFDQQLLSLC